MSMKILVGAQDDEFLLTCSNFLELDGYGVVAASKSEAILRHLSSYRPRILLLDIHLPGSSVSVILQKIHNDGSIQKLTVVLLYENKVSPVKLPLNFRIPICALPKDQLYAQMKAEICRRDYYSPSVKQLLQHCSHFSTRN